MTSTLEAPTLQREQTRIPIIDADVHPFTIPTAPGMVAYLPKRWQRYVAEYGALHLSRFGERPRHREYAHRWDTEPPGGGAAGSNPDFARQQLLDRYDMSAGILNDIGGFRMAGGGGQPAELSVAYCRAMNEYRRDHWLRSDPRWFGSITVPYELPVAAAEEIRYCKEEMGEFGSRWVQIMMAPDNMRPAGHPSYWPIYEACQHYDIPLGFHVGTSQRATPSGPPNYYFEEHCDFALFNFPLISSLIFEGVFERFPRLKVVLVELAWSWAVPLSWRLDHAFRVNRTEVPHLSRLPSEYMADHVFYTTQPMEEPENPAWFGDVLEVFESSGFGDNLLYSSDYPHWDFDEPASFPRSMGDEQLRRVLSGNAHKVYGIDTIPGSGFTRE
jgi:predicted TIM-barrel fold metal-dependent hydrolase